MIKEIFKSAVWGFVLLLLSILMVVSIFFSYSRSTDFYTYNLMMEYKNTLRETSEKLDKLEAYVDAKRSNEIYWHGYNDETVLKLVSDIESNIKNNCPSCNIYLSIPDSSYEVSNFKEKLQRKSNSELIKNSNTLNSLLLLAAIVSFLISTYLLIGLFRYKKLKADGLILLILITVPFLTVSSTFMFMNISEYMTLDFGQKSVNLILGSFVYLFIIYPIIFSIVKNKNYNLINIIKLCIEK